MSDINHWAVIVAAISAFIIGGLWYAPPVFGRSWQRAAGLSDAQLASGKPAVIFGGGFVLALIAAYVLHFSSGQNPHSVSRSAPGSRRDSAGWPRASASITCSSAGIRGCS